MGINAKLSDLTESSALASGALIYIVEGGNSRKKTLSTVTAGVLNDTGHTAVRTSIGLPSASSISAMTAILESVLANTEYVTVTDVDRGGLFKVLSGTPAANGLTADSGTVFASDGGGYTFQRVFTGFVELAFFGAVRDSRASAATNDTAIVNAISYCAANKKPLWIIGNYFISDTIVPAVSGQGIQIYGAGPGYWPALPAAKRSTTDDIVVAAPAQLTVTGTVTRDISVVGISSMKECGASRTNASAEGAGFNDTEFRLLDWSSSAFSAAVDVPAGTLGGGIRGLRIVLDQGGDDGLDGYFGAKTTSYDELTNSECDVGILLERCPDFSLDSVHVVGTWRKTGRFILTTPRDGDETDDAHNVSPYNMVARDCIFEGYKATSIRGYDSFKIVAITATTLDVIYADDHPFDTGGGTIYLHQNQYATTSVTYTSAAQVAGSPDVLRFSGLGTDLTGTYSAGDGIEPFEGGGSSGILDDHCRYGGYHHPSGYQCHATALPNPFSFPGGGIEISGRRITEITFKNWMIQHVEQIGWHLHECREIFFGEAGQAEGNVPNGSSLQGLKFIGSPHHSVNTYNTPGSASYSSGGTFYTYVGCSDMIFGDPNDFRPQVPMVSVGRWSNGSDNGFWEPNYSRMPQAAFTADMDQGPALVPPTGGSAGIVDDQGPSSANQLPSSHDPVWKFRYDASVDKNKTHVDLLPNLNNTYDLGGSGAQYAQVWTFNVNSGAAGLNFVINGTQALTLNSTLMAFKPDNTVSCGSGSFRSSVVYSATGTINTSDEREKQDVDAIPDEWLDAWGEVEFIRYKWKDAVQKKKDGARWHVGLIAQRVRDVFAAHGLDATQIGLLCYDEWADIPAEFDKDGNEIAPFVPAGNRYGLRYEEAFALEAAYQRREIERLKNRPS